jgi:hypothetical protein
VSRIKHKLKELGKSFVFVPADKAANNVINLAFTEHNLLLQQHHHSLFFCANFPSMQGSTLTF